MQFNELLPGRAPGLRLGVLLFAAAVLAGRVPMTVADSPATSTAPAEAASPMRVLELRCAYRVNPLGLDTARPRLSWVLASDRPKEVQSAYHILAASSIEKLHSDVGDLWDTGKVVSNRQNQLSYAGAPLASGQRCWWKVRVWDGADAVSGWSEPAWFEMGLLQPDDWQGRWIAGQPDKAMLAAPFDLAGLRWIWYPEADPKAEPPKEAKRYFRRVFEVPADRPVQRAQWLLTMDDVYTVWVNGELAGSGSDWPMLQILDVTAALKPGANVLAAEAHNLGDAAGAIGQLRIDFATGEPMFIATDAQWRCTDTLAADWQQASFDDAGWLPARELSKYGEPPWGPLHLMPPGRPAPLLRRAFVLDKPVKRARAYVCGVGYHELYLNGTKAGDHVLDPAFTDYDDRALYVTHDVTDLLHQGPNAIGVMLGTGWYNMHTKAVWFFNKAPWRDAPCAKVELLVEHLDGTSTRISTDEHWKVMDGPVVYNAIRNGESYDARAEVPDWCAPVRDESDMQPVIPVGGPKGRLAAQEMDPIRVTRTLKPVALTEPVPGEFVFDLGQNIAGWARIRVQGPAGTRITLRYSERLNSEGRIDQERIAEHSRDPRFQRDEYVLRGEGVECWEPRFVYHGYQYVEVTGWPGKPTLDDLDGRVVHTDCPQVGTFTCSNELFNKIQQCTLWSYVSNYHGYPTDCPHREKNGWTGDAHMAAVQAMYNFNNAPGYTKWIDDMAEAMRPSGELPGIVPTSGWGYEWANGPAWDSAYLLIPWYMYQYYGDLNILETHYEGFKKYVDYLTAKADGHITAFGLGDWVPLDQKTPEAITSTAYYYQDALIVARTAKLLGKDDEAKRYQNLADEIRKAFRAKFFDRDSARVGEATQTAQACAIYQDLLSKSDAHRAAGVLVKNIAAQNGHINSGVLGSIYIPHALSRTGYGQIAYDLAAKTDYPSWGHWISQGATTLWEDWPGGASRNHIFFGDISAWFYQELAGLRIDPDKPGFERVIIRPFIPKGLTFARAEVHTIRGPISAGWKIEGRHLHIEVNLPPNTTARVIVPADDPRAVRINDKTVHVQQELVTYQGCQENECTFEAGSGRYVFTMLR